MEERIKVSNLREVQELKESAELPISQDGVSYKTSVGHISQIAKNGLDSKFLGKTETAESAKGSGRVTQDNELAVSGSEIDKYINNFTLKDKSFSEIKFSLERGTWGTLGNHDNSANWIKTSKIQTIGNTTYKVKGAGNSSQLLNERRIFYWDENGKFIKYEGKNSGYFEFKTPPNCTSYSVVVDSGINVGISPSESPFNTNMHILKELENGVLLDASKIKGDIETPQIENIESKISDIKKTDYGYGAPNYCNNNDIYIDLYTNLKWVKKNNFWNIESKEIPIKYIYENIFLRNTLEYYRLRNKTKYIPKYNGKFIFNIIDLIKESILDFVYVDVKNGLDTNDGKINTPFKTISKAVKDGFKNILVRKGFYHRNESDLVRYTISQEYLNIICENGVYFTSADKSTDYTWTKESNMFKTTRSAVSSIIDISIYLNDKEGYKHYVEVFTKQECDNTLYSFFKDANNVLYINTESIVSDIKLILKGAQFELTLSSENKHILIENANFYISSDNASLFIKSDLSTQTDSYVYLKNIKSYLNVLGDALAIDNIKSVFVQNCFGYATKRDALNYHTSVSSFDKMEVIEINGSSYDTGKYSLTESSSNGSTAHDGMSISRFGGNFERARGSVVVDVNVGIKSINFDVTAIESYLPTTASFQIQNGKAWYINCVAYDSTNSIKVDGSQESVAYIDKETKILGDKIGNIVEI